jgi:hypothetical protein
MRRKDEGMLFLRGRIWWYKAPNGERVSTGTTIESEAIEFKIRKPAELRIGLPHSGARNGAEYRRPED